ncbi:MAG: hypothetical protein FWD75_06645 [Propionibacteriaceae bacterium]|nr:hypothetical protein [Propionibacteriaceae bacterium]
MTTVTATVSGRVAPHAHGAVDSDPFRRKIRWYHPQTVPDDVMPTT